jgi:hypothetical protein
MLNFIANKIVIYNVNPLMHIQANIESISIDNFLNEFFAFWVISFIIIIVTEMTHSLYNPSSFRWAEFENLLRLRSKE